MKLIRINSDSPLWASAWKLYETSFPEYERRSAEQQKEIMENKGFCPYAATDDHGRLTAIIFWWVYDDTVYIEHLAVEPAMRGLSIGSMLVKELVSLYPGHTVVLEIDPPEDEISRRRKRFYERLGFVANDDCRYVHPSYRTGKEGRPHDLVLMSSPKPMTGKQVEDFIRFMGTHVLPENKSESDIRLVRCVQE